MAEIIKYMVHIVFTQDKQATEFVKSCSGLGGPVSAMIFGLNLLKLVSAVFMAFPYV